jgi:hypothetical protein
MPLPTPCCATWVAARFRRRVDPQLCRARHSQPGQARPGRFDGGGRRCHAAAGGGAGQLQAPLQCRERSPCRSFPGVAKAWMHSRRSACRSASSPTRPRHSPCRCCSVPACYPYFDVIVSGDVLPRPKPDPMPLLWASGRLGRVAGRRADDRRFGARFSCRQGGRLPCFSGALRLQRRARCPRSGL